MQLTLKLYATLSEYLPEGARQNAVTIDRPEGVSVAQVVRELELPRNLVHLVLINGVYVAPEQLEEAVLKEGDVLAIWPPVAGG